MEQIRYKTRTVSAAEDGITSSITFQGTREEMENMRWSNPPGSEYYDGNDDNVGGRIKCVRVYQDEGPLWCCELQMTTNQHTQVTRPPDISYGTKSATLECGLLSMPLESHPNYRIHWDHHLAGNGTDTIPAGWEDATDTYISDKRYRWVSSPDELPQGGTWKILKKASKLGVTGYEVSTYVIRESVRCKTSQQAGRICANAMNKIATPDNDFGITGGNWKCDGVSIRWTGQYWLATLTYTRSGDEKGWDQDLYGEK